MTDLERLRYPVGRFQETVNPDSATRATWIKIIADFPSTLRAEVAGLNAEELATPYRPGGWTIQQVVHHCADSHMNAITRFKWTLTEDQPTIKPYAEAEWAKLPDVDLPIIVSLDLLSSLHTRWAHLLAHMTEAQYQRSFFHPQHGIPFSLTLGLDHYQWHCRHHLGHVRLGKSIPGY